MEFLQLGGNIPSRSGPCHFPCDTMAFIGFHIPFPSPGLASWGRLFHADREVEHCGIPSEHRVSAHCGSVFLLCAHLLVNLNGGKRLGVWLHRPSLSSAFSSFPHAWLFHGISHPPLVAPEVHVASCEQCFSISQHSWDVQVLL